MEKLGNFPVFQGDSEKKIPLPDTMKLSDKKALWGNDAYSHGSHFVIRRERSRESQELRTRSLMSLNHWIFPTIVSLQDYLLYKINKLLLLKKNSKSFCYLKLEAFLVIHEYFEIMKTQFLILKKKRPYTYGVARINIGHQIKLLQMYDFLKTMSYFSM